MNTANITIGDRDFRTVTIGIFRSKHQGEILLVYLHDGDTDATVMRYDQLSGNERHLVRTADQDPLSVLTRTTVERPTSCCAA